MKLNLTNVSIAYGRSLVLRDVNISIEEKEACVLAGPNGSGKTSLMRCLLGLKAPRQGERRCDFDSIGYVPQTRLLDRRFPVTVERCLEMSFTGFKYLWNREARRKMAEEIKAALAAAGIAHRAGHLLRECSGGELQRTLIARALVHRPRLLALDEPTNSVDAEGKREILRLLERLHREEGLTILMTTHETDPEVFKIFKTRILIVDGSARKEELKK